MIPIPFRPSSALPNHINPETLTVIVSNVLLLHSPQALSKMFPNLEQGNCPEKSVPLSGEMRVDAAAAEARSLMDASFMEHDVESQDSGDCCGN